MEGEQAGKKERSKEGGKEREAEREVRKEGFLIYYQFNWHNQRENVYFKVVAFTDEKHFFL